MNLLDGLDGVQMVNTGINTNFVKNRNASIFGTKLNQKTLDRIRALQAKCS